MNDYPARPARGEIADADRLKPGDGVAPVGAFYRALAAIGYRGFVSVELFRPVYRGASAAAVAAEALRKMRAAWPG